MTDRERASALVAAQAVDDLLTVEQVEEQFAAVRADERRAIVAWLRGYAALLTGAAREVLVTEADAIEGGAHAREARS